MPRFLANAIRTLVAAALMFPAILATPAGAQAPSGPPIRIGVGLALTGQLASNGKAALAAMRIWVADQNAKGGLLGRPVDLVVYDDQSNPSSVPFIYTKLIEVDKVDLIVGGYATNMLAPAVPVAMAHNKVFIGLQGTAVNSEFHYSKYFSMIPTGPDPKTAMTKGFFELAMAQKEKPRTVAIVGADAEFSHNTSEGARQLAKTHGLNIVYDRSYPPAMTDFAPTVRAIQSANPDLVVVCSYPLDGVGIVRAVNEIGFSPKMIGGAMVGLQNASLMMQLGPLLNGWVNYVWYLPVKALQFPGLMEVLDKYQARAAAEGLDPLGYHTPPLAYADLQVLAQAVEAVKGFDQDKLADYMHKATFKTVVGDVTFGPDGEWVQSRVLTVQFRNIASKNLDEFKDMTKQVIVAPEGLKTGELIYPRAGEKK
jgi:branched-chain amino acid transport system substrate-binding protein